LWTRRAILTKEEIKQMKEERAAAAKQVPGIGDAQRFFLRSELMAAHHTGFVNRVMAALRGAELAATELSAKDALILAREALYRETAGSQWKPTLIGDRVMPRLAEDENETPGNAGLLWPSSVWPLATAGSCPDQAPSLNSIGTPIHLNAAWANSVSSPMS
jgi:intracellular multiplication protein IcmB